MSGFGLYYALRGKNNWAQRRQDARLNMQMQSEMASMEEQKLQQSLMAEKEMQDAFDKVREMEYLEGDKERIFAKEKQLRSNVIKQIGAYNGDLRRYMAAGGLSDLRNYQRGLEDSEEVKLAKTNKSELLRYMQDSKKGDQYFFKTRLKIPKLDADNNPTGEFEERDVDMNEQLALHNKGIINTLQYAGSEKAIPVNMMAFKNQFKDERNPLGDNRVSQSDIYTYATKLGASHEQAMDQVNQYGNTIKQGGDVWTWKSVDPEMYNLQKQLNKSKINKLKASGGGKNGLTAGTIVQTHLDELDKLQNGQATKTVPPVKESLMLYSGFIKDSDNNWKNSDLNKEGYVATKEGGFTGNKVRISGNNVVNVDPTEGRIYKDENGSRFLEATVTLNSEGGDDEGTAVEQGFLWDTKAEGLTEYINEVGDNLYQHKVYIPVEGFLNQSSFRQDLAKNVGHKAGSTAYMGSAYEGRTDYNRRADYYQHLDNIMNLENQ